MATSANQLKEFYKLTTHGSSQWDAAKTIGIAPESASAVARNLRKYISWVLSGEPKDGRKRRKNYVIAARWAVMQDNMSVKKDVPSPGVEDTTPKDVVHTQPSGVPTHYGKLDMAFMLFSDTVQAFIKAEVDKQVGEVMRENEEMKKLIDSARIGNMSEALKKYWEGKK